MNKTSKIIFVAVVSATLWTGCHKTDCSDPVPVIGFKDFIQYQDSAKLIITFKDCDGDVGLSDGDTTGDYKYNLFLTYMELDTATGSWVSWLPCEETNNQYPCLLAPFYYRVPVARAEGRSPVQEGEIEVVISPRYYGPNATEVKFSAYLKDYKLNKSNLIETPALQIPQ